MYMRDMIHWHLHVTWFIHKCDIYVMSRLCIRPAKGCTNLWRCCWQLVMVWQYMYMCDMIHWRLHVTWFIHKCDIYVMSRLCIRPAKGCTNLWRYCWQLVMVWQYMYMCDVIHWRLHVTWFIHKCDIYVMSCLWIHSAKGCTNSWRYCWQLVMQWWCMCDMIHLSDMTHSYVWHDSFICVTWRIHMCDMTEMLLAIVNVVVVHVCHDSFTSVTCVLWFIHKWDMTRGLVVICVTWLICECDTYE